MNRSAAVSFSLCVSLAVPAWLAPPASSDEIVLLMERGRWKEARSAVEARAKSLPDDPQTLNLRSRVQLAFADGEGALALAEKAAERDPKSAAHRYQVAEACGYLAQTTGGLKRMGYGRRFKKEAEAALALDSRHVQAHATLIQFHSMAPGIAGGDKKKAHALAEELVKLAPVRGYLAQAQLALREKNDARAEALYRRAIEADPGSYEAQMGIANFYRLDSQKKYELSERHARAAIAIDRGRVGGYALLAGLNAGLERWSDLDAVLAESAREVPGNLTPQYQAARILVLEGKDPGRAEAYLRRYLSQEPEGGSPTHAHARWRLGLALEKQGRRPEAAAELEAALKLNPDLDEAKKDLKRLKRG